MNLIEKFIRNTYQKIKGRPKEEITIETALSGYMKTWARNAIKTIDDQLAVEIKRRGLEDDIKTRKLKLDYFAKINENNPIEKNETWSIKGQKILVVAWSAGGFKIHVKNRQKMRPDIQLINKQNKHNIQVINEPGKIITL